MARLSTQHRYVEKVSKFICLLSMVSSCYQLTLVLSQYSPLLPPAELDLEILFHISPFLVLISNFAGNLIYAL